LKEGYPSGKLRPVTVETTWNRLYQALDGIEVEDLWDRAGPSRYGYTSPEDMAAEMIDEELNPFIAEII